MNNIGWFQLSGGVKAAVGSAKRRYRGKERRRGFFMLLPMQPAERLRPMLCSGEVVDGVPVVTLGVCTPELLAELQAVL